jgi:hypothetical protein
LLVSAEIRWFWKEHCPVAVETWFRTSGESPGGGSLRNDRYLHSKGNVELGVKVRGEEERKPLDVEVKGLVCFSDGSKIGMGAEDIEVWCKWKGPIIAMPGGVSTKKRRWLRKFNAEDNAPFEIKVGPDEKPEGKVALPQVGCNLEFTEIAVGGRPEQWWSLCFEAFGDLRSAPDALVRVVKMLGPHPDFDGTFASYPRWIDGL